MSLTEGRRSQRCHIITVASFELQVASEFFETGRKAKVNDPTSRSIVF